MINTKEFTVRLEKILAYYNESASSFSEKIGVPRSSISHIISGRNKPSLDFVMKVLAAFPEVELYWLLNGKGSFPSNKDSNGNEKLPTPKSSVTPETPKTSNDNSSKKIERIVIFYEDGTFRNFIP